MSASNTVDMNPFEVLEMIQILERIALVNHTFGEGWHTPDPWGMSFNSEAWQRIQPQVQELLQTVANTTSEFYAKHVSALVDSSAVVTGPQISCKQLAIMVKILKSDIAEALHDHNTQLALKLEAYLATLQPQIERCNAKGSAL